MKAVILAAGRGTRLGALTENVPKPMILVAGKPVLEHVMLQVRESGISDFVLVVRYLAEKVIDHFGDGSKFGVNIDYVHQPDDKYGTGAGLMCTRNAVAGDSVLMTFGDVLSSSDTYKGVTDTIQCPGCDASSALNWVDDPWRSAAVLTSEDGSRVTGVIEKPAKGSIPSHWNNSGIFAFQPLVFDYLSALKPSARGEYEITDAFNAMISDGLCVKPFYMDGPWMDVGTPEDVVRAEDFVQTLQVSNE